MEMALSATSAAPIEIACLTAIAIVPLPLSALGLLACRSTCSPRHWHKCRRIKMLWLPPRRLIGKGELFLEEGAFQERHSSAETYSRPVDPHRERLTIDLSAKVKTGLSL